MAVKLGIIGLGRLGRKHAENIHYHIQNAELRAICSVVPEELHSVSGETAPKYVTADYREIIGNDDLDGIVIASSSQEHCVMICDAAAAGRKNVHTEKPIGMTMPEIDDIKAAVEARPDMRFQVGYNRRFDRSGRRAQSR